MEKQLRGVETMLEKMNDKFLVCGAEQRNVKAQYGVLSAELRKTRQKCAKIEEEQVETEFALKTEIKLLLSKLATTNKKLAELGVQDASKSGNDDVSLSTKASQQCTGETFRACGGNGFLTKTFEAYQHDLEGEL